VDLSITIATVAAVVYDNYLKNDETTSSRRHLQIKHDIVPDYGGKPTKTRTSWDNI
jgi:hypothetical protein